MYDGKPFEIFLKPVVHILKLTFSNTDMAKLVIENIAVQLLKH